MKTHTGTDRTQGKTALVTGSSSGIGHACVVLLAREGFHVFAGVRNAEDARRLQSEGGDLVTPVMIDVADAASVSAAAGEVAGALGERGLDGLVNVAGIGVSGPLEYVTPEELRRVFEVNVFGQIAVIQALMPLIRKARGRIVNISSVGAHIAIPFGGVLCASKSAFGSLTDALRMELQPFGVRVIAIEPASIRTPAVEKTLGDVEGVIRSLPPEGARRYGDTLRRFTERAYARESNGSPPEVVARAVRHALTARRPRIRYAVGKGAAPLTILPRLLSDHLLDGFRRRMLGLPALMEKH